MPSGYFFIFFQIFVRIFHIFSYFFSDFLQHQTNIVGGARWYTRWKQKKKKKKISRNVYNNIQRTRVLNIERFLAFTGDLKSLSTHQAKGCPTHHFPSLALKTKQKKKKGRGLYIHWVLRPPLLFFSVLFSVLKRESGE